MMTDATLTRPARTEQTRARIVAAAREVFIAQGYRASSLRDVAAAAAISHPGLVKHFATKDLLLAAVVGEFERESELALLDELAAYAGGTLPYAAVAARNARIPGYLPLFAALVGEGSTSGHPAHRWMRDRYARLREAASDSLADAIQHGVVDPARDPRSEAARLAAVWDGVQLLELYLPDRVDVVDLLREYQEMLTSPPGWRAEPAPTRPAAPSATPPLTAPGGAADDAGGYRVGRERRARILADATALFARDGYADTSLRDIAAAVGVSKSALLHHYPSKEALLSAVLAERDRRVSERTSTLTSGATDFLRDLPLGAALNAESGAGLVEVYAVLSCEALPEDHPAHTYFTDRFTWALAHFTSVLEAARADGMLPTHRDPAREAIRLVALWDGLQYQWLYDRDSVDVAAELTRHLDDVLGYAPDSAMTASTDSP